MKNIHNYNTFINESIKDKMKGKSKDKFIKMFNDKYPIFSNIFYELFPNNEFQIEYKNGLIDYFMFTTNDDGGNEHRFMIEKIDNNLEKPTISYLLKKGKSNISTFLKKEDISNINDVKKYIRDCMNSYGKMKIPCYPTNESIKDKLKGKDINTIIKKLGDDYNKILLKSIEFGYMDGIKHAINNGADICYNDGKPMTFALLYNNLDAIKLLLDLDYDYYSKEILDLMSMIQDCNYEVVKYLLDNFEFDNYSIDKSINYLKYESSRKDVLELFKKYKLENDNEDNDNKSLKSLYENDDYINFKKTINKDNYSKYLLTDLFIDACNIGKNKYVEYLLQRKLVDKNTKSGAPMINACYYGNLDVVKTLIKYGVKPTEEHAEIAENHLHSNISDYILKYLSKSKK